MPDLTGLLKAMRASSGDAKGADLVSEVSQTYEDGSSVTIVVRKIKNGFLTKKETFTPMDKDKPNSEQSERDWERQHRCEEFFTVKDPRTTMTEKPLKEEKEDFFSKFVLETGLMPIDRRG